MKIKRYFAAALVLLCLCGCGSSGTSDVSSQNEPAVDVVASESTESEAVIAESSDDLKTVFDKISTSVELPEMVTLNEKLIDRYYGLTTESVADFAGGVDSSGVGQDEIVLMKAVDESKVAEIEQALQTRYDSKLAQQENYNADEAEKIRKCKVETNGLYVTLIISNDADAINEIVKSAIG